MREDQAHDILQRDFHKLVTAVVKSFETYRTRYPHRPIHRKTTAANVICDEVWAEIINCFAEDSPRIRPIERPYGLRLLGVQGPSGETEILLWFKKVNGQRKAGGYLTKTARNRLNGGNVEMFEEATVLVVGYQLSHDETKVLRVSLSKPARGKPEWYIDLELPSFDDKKIVKMGSEAGPATAPRVVVKRVRQLKLAE